MLRKIRQTDRFALSAISGALLSLSFPGINISLFAYFSFVPLFFALRGAVKKEAFFISFICGLVFFGITIFWMRFVSIPGLLSLVMILSVFFGLFGQYSLRIISLPLASVFLLPAFWVVLEFIRSNILTGFGWVLLGHSQYLNIPVIQISDLTGAYGVSFFVMMVNVIIFKALGENAKKIIPAYFMVFFSIFAVLGYGYFRLNNSDTVDKTLSISLIQGNIPQPMKWDPDFRKGILDKYVSITERAAKENPDLIIWPETSLPGFMEEEGLAERVSALSKDLGTDILVGAPSYRDLDGATLYNSAFLISGDGYIGDSYDKIHLVPFGEYIPFGKYTNFVRRFIDKPIGDFAKGDDYTIFEIKGGLRFGVLICFEDIFSDLTRRFTSKGADFMVNITNDAWFMKTAAPYQHAQSAVFRAVENRIPFVRAANTGLSCFIDKYGRIFDTVNLNGQEIFVSGHKTNRISISKSRSFYREFGNVFVFICMICVIVSGRLFWRKSL